MIDSILLYLPRLLQGVQMTLLVSITSLLGAFLLGLIGAQFRLSQNPVLRHSALIYSTVLRGVPELLWMLFLYYGVQAWLNQWTEHLGYSRLEINPFWAGVFTLSLVYGAYFTETFRGAIMAIPKGQIEAGTAFGLTKWQIFKRITFPQMMRYALPGTRNNWMALSKATALISVVGLEDLVRIAKQAGQAQNASLAFNLFTGLVFLLITMFSVKLFDRLEAKYRQGILEASYGQ